MTITEIRNKVFAELDSRGLADPSIRKRALNHILEYVRQSEYFNKDEVNLPSNKKLFKQGYEVFKGKNLNGAENSVINEMYKQYEL